MPEGRILSEDTTYTENDKMSLTSRYLTIIDRNGLETSHVSHSVDASGTEPSMLLLPF